MELQQNVNADAAIATAEENQASAQSTIAPPNVIVVGFDHPSLDGYLSQARSVSTGSRMVAVAACDYIRSCRRYGLLPIEKVEISLETARRIVSETLPQLDLVGVENALRDLDFMPTNICQPKSLSSHELEALETAFRKYEERQKTASIMRNIAQNVARIVSSSASEGDEGTSGTQDVTDSVTEVVGAKPVTSTTAAVPAQTPLSETDKAPSREHKTTLETDETISEVDKTVVLLAGDDAGKLLQPYLEEFLPEEVSLVTEELPAAKPSPALRFRRQSAKSSEAPALDFSRAAAAVL